MKKWLLIGFLAVTGWVLMGATICFFIPRKATVHLDRSTSCELRTDGFYHWFTDQQMPLVCWRNGQEIGRVEFTFDHYWFRTAIFPTGDKHSLVCFSQTDLTMALFVIDLEHSSGPERSVPQDFFIPNENIVKSTSFALRRCPPDEVRSLKRYIETADNRTLRSSWVEILPTDFFLHFGKDWLLTKIEHITDPNHIPAAGEIPSVRRQR